MIPAGDSTKTISVMTTQDDKNEADENFTLTLSVPADLALVALGSQSTATGTILSDDTPVFSISDVRIAEGNDPDSEDVNIEFVIAISSGATKAETIRYATSDGPAQSGGAVAKAGSDYTATIGSHEFALNGNKTHTVAVPISEDMLYELDESFTITLSGNDTSSTELLVSSAVGTIENDDEFMPSVIAVVAKSDYVTEGDAIELEFTADPELAENLAVNISHVQVGDYLMAIPGSTITIPANTTLTNKHTESFATKSANGDVEADGVLTFTIEADTYFPDDPTDRLNYSVDTNNGSAKVRIEDDDTPSGVSIIALSSEVTEGEDAQFEIKAKTTSTDTREININVSEDTTDFLDSNEKGDRSITIPADNRVYILDVPIAEDSDPELHGDITVAISPTGGSSSTYNVADTYNTATVSVYDDDAPAGNSIAVISTPVTEAANAYAEFQVITATKDEANDRTIEVRVENASGDDFIDVANQDATYNYDSSDNIFDVTIPAGSRFGLLRVKIHEDSKNEDNGAIMATVVTTSCRFS